MELSDVIKELEELKTRVSELENRITKEEVPDISDLSWVKYVAADEDGEIWAYAIAPIMGFTSWMEAGGGCEAITIDMAVALCGRVPQWPDKPTRVKQ